MPGYANGSLHQWNSIKPKNPQHQTYPAPGIMHGTYEQKMKPIDMSPAISMERVKQIEWIVGKSLYYARGVYNTWIVPLSDMSSIIDPTEQHENNLNQLLDYRVTYPNAIIRFHASYMILHANTNAWYLTEPQSHSHAAGYLLLGSTPSKYARYRLNVTVHVNCNILIFFYRLCSRSRNQGLLRNRKRSHHFTKRVRRNLPPTDYYTSMQGRYNNFYHC